MKKLLPILALLLASATAQATAQTFPQITTQKLTFNGAAAPQPVSQATVQLVGNPGNQTYYVWIVANFAVGNATPSQPFMIRNAPVALSASNYLFVSWSAITGATGYDVLLTTTDRAPSGACGCAAATGVTGTTENITSNTTSAYTVNTYSGSPVFELDNLAGPLVFRYNAGEIAHLTAGGTFYSGSDPLSGISGSATTGDCVDFASATTIQDAGAPCGSGSGGVSSLQFDSNTALTGAIKVVSGPGLSTLQTGQQVTLNPNTASGTQIGMVQLTNCLGGTDTAPTVTCMPWSDLTAPTGALSLSMGANVSTFTFGAATGAGVNLFNLTDTASNSGTGYLFTAKVASGSAASPFEACGTFNCLKVSNTGRLEIGNGAMAADTSSQFSLLDSNGNGIVALIDNNSNAGGGGMAPSGFTNSSSGTTLNGLASLTSTGASTTLTSATTGAIGVVMANAGTSGSVIIVTSGIAYCQFDATAVVEGDWVNISSTTAGDCHDAGSTKPASGEIVGIATSTGSASTKQYVDVQISW